MEKSSEIESKYHKLAAEYSKVRSQAAVLKKAVLDEQAKTTQLNEVIKKQEQTLRKHDQEMESLIFRNDQLAKRISVLQQELQINSHPKKGKIKPIENSNLDVTVLDEELHKKILENAQLLSTVADKDNEILDFKDRIEWLEEQASNLQDEFRHKESKYCDQISCLTKEKEFLQKKVREMLSSNSKNEKEFKEGEESIIHWKMECEKWKGECELLRSKPNTNEQLTEYYESQLRDILEAKIIAQSESKTVWAENFALKARLENLTLEHNQLQNNLEKSYEELVTTTDNYKSQLDAMTEHLAAQNEKITQQCDEIQLLKHRLATKK